MGDSMSSNYGTGEYLKASANKNVINIKSALEVQKAPSGIKPIRIPNSLFVPPQVKQQSQYKVIPIDLERLKKEKTELSEPQ